MLLHAAALGERAAVALADPDRLRQVFGNLVENAIRYTDPGGTISVSETLTPDNVLLTMEDPFARRAGRQAAPAVRAVLPRRRAPATGRTGGSGLGLAICRAIVEAHSGTISAAASSLGRLGGDRDLARGTRDRPMTLIAIVEDEASIADILEAYLQREGFATHCLSHRDGGGGLAAVRPARPRSCWI